MMANAREALKEASQEIFNKYKNLKSFGHLQYTPYFNDGDPCEFRVYSDFDYGLSINGAEEGIEYYEAGWCFEKSEFLNQISGSPLLTKQMLEDIHGFINSCPIPILKTLGEGQVVFYRNGEILVEEYDHD
jgi:hypothetical protein